MWYLNDSVHPKSINTPMTQSDRGNQTNRKTCEKIYRHLNRRLCKEA